ncbi:MAG: GH3 auxin-responsive promoter family protein [Phycisphaerae bacterium]|nr:GH3 auxin-responsive promoter family protein [Phycisphaerae bacterium]
MSRWRATRLIGVALSAWLSRRARLLADVEFWRRNTSRLQVDQLRQLLQRAASTEFGRGHRFKTLLRATDVDLVSAYRCEVPIADIAAFRPLIARMREGGEPNVLWPGLVRAFAQTSGTTAGDKYIPVSQEMMRGNLRAAMDLFATSARFGTSLAAMTAGRCVFLGGSTALAMNEHGIATGDLSGLVTPLIRWPASAVYSPGPDIALMRDWPRKIEALARLTLEQDVTFVSGMASWELVLFKRVVELARERGQAVGQLRDIWPNLAMLVHGGVNYAPFAASMRDVWSGSRSGEDFPHRLEVYPASEGFIAMQDSPGDPGLRLLADNGIHYEFVPLEQGDCDDAEAFTCAEVELGQRYLVVMSTNAGLWRYRIGDVVEFDSVPARPDGRSGTGPCRLRIVGRQKHFINAFGENLIVENIEMAVTAAASATGAVIGEFTAAPVYPTRDQRAGLELIVELDRSEREHDAALLRSFRGVFDSALCALSVDYSVKRSGDCGMSEPTVTFVPTGSVHRWMAACGKLGGQHKCPRCANHREYVDGVRRAAGVSQ